VVQDAGVYILATSVFLFLLHAGAHLLRYGVTISGRELYFGARLELAGALPLLTLTMGVILFYPS